MGQAIAVRTDFTAGEVRRFAKRAKDAAQARRLLAIAAVLDGALREDAAKIGGWRARFGSHPKLHIIKQASECAGDDWQNICRYL